MLGEVFAQIADRSCVADLIFYFRTVVSGDRDDGRCMWHRGDSPSNLVAIQSGHIPIEADDIKICAIQPTQSFLPIYGLRHLVSKLTERNGNHNPMQEHVVHDQSGSGTESFRAA